MIQSLQELDAIYSGTPLAGRRIAAVQIPDSRHAVFALEVGADAPVSWEYARAMLPETGCGPVLATLAFARENERWEDQVADARLFNRHEFAQECRDDSPDAIIAAAKDLDVDLLCSELPQDDISPIEESIEPELRETAALFGTAPALEDAMAFLAGTDNNDPLALDRWCFEWELNHCREPLSLPAHGFRHLEWHNPKNETQALLLMPTENGWEIPAYINWYAASRGNSQSVLALLRAWQLQHSAELLAHYGTMLHFTVQQRPRTAACGSLVSARAALIERPGQPQSQLR